MHANDRRGTARVRHRRYRAVLGALVALMGLFAVLLGRVQIIEGSSYAAKAAGELNQVISTQSMRGSIYDRSGDLLAVSVPRYDIIADDFLVTSAPQVARELAPLLRHPVRVLQSQLVEHSGYVILARQVEPRTESAVMALGASGISSQIDALRVAPGASVFQPVLGGVNAAGRGYAGLEYAYDKVLAGRDGKEIVPLGPGGVELPGQPEVLSHAVAGRSLVLSLDEPLQVETTKDVAAEMQASHASSGVAVVEDVHTGAIVAMVNLCRLRRDQCSASGRIGPAPQNLAVTSVYQPGSVMKIATVSYALHYHLISPTSVFSVPYSLSIGGYTFEDAESHPTIDMPVSQILAQSSNVGTIKIGRLLGPERLSQALGDYGFGHYTGLNWPGESPGLVNPVSSWQASTAATVAIGTGESVTPMQILDAYAAIANGGMMIEPRLIDGTVGPTGEVTPLRAPKPHRVIDATTASEMVPMFEGVVQDGTAVSACVPGYTVAGKTGTAQAPSTTGPGYVPNDFNATFVGFVPAQAPRLAAIVVFHHPAAPNYYGGSVSAPVFAKIMGYALRHFDIAPPASSPDTPVQCASGRG